MALTYRCFKNKATGQVCYVEAGRFGNFKNSIKKLVNYIRCNIARYYIAHVTLTVAENRSEIDFKDIHRVLQFIAQRLKRVGSDFKYVAVKELQERGAIHYHVICNNEDFRKKYVRPKLKARYEQFYSHPMKHTFSLAKCNKKIATVTAVSLAKLQ